MCYVLVLQCTVCCVLLLTQNVAVVLSSPLHPLLPLLLPLQALSPYTCDQDEGLDTISFTSGIDGTVGVSKVLQMYVICLYSYIVILFHYNFFVFDHSHSFIPSSYFHLRIPVLFPLSFLSFFLIQVGGVGRCVE